MKQAAKNAHNLLRRKKGNFRRREAVRRESKRIKKMRCEQEVNEVRKDLIGILKARVIAPSGRENR